MPSIDDLMREIAQLRTENDMLKMLLKENGIDLPIVAADPTLQDESPTDAAVTKRSPLPEKSRSSSPCFRDDPMYMPAAGRAKTDAPATVQRAKTNGSPACA